MSAPPITEADYSHWLERTFKYVSDDASRHYYLVVVDKLRESLAEGQLWADFLRELHEAHDTYYIERHAVLLLNLVPQLVTKPYDSFFKKGYRRNVVNNPNWPSPPDLGWTEPANWFASIPDVVRTVLVVKYLDGIPFIASRIADFGEAKGLDYRISMEARTEGYYAAHAQFVQTVEIPGRDWQTLRVDACIEVQFTTQLQDVMRGLLHRDYEQTRLAPAADPLTWQWDHRAPQFRTGYLGHVLHYLEGKIVEIREEQETPNG